MLPVREQHPLTGSQTQTHTFYTQQMPHGLTPLCILCCEGSPGRCPTLVLQIPKPDKTTVPVGWDRLRASVLTGPVRPPPGTTRLVSLGMIPHKYLSFDIFCWQDSQAKLAKSHGILESLVRCPTPQIV